MILALLGLLPIIPKLVLGVERLVGHGSGATKKSSVMGDLALLLNAFAQTTGTAGADSSVMEFIDTFVEQVVTLFNKTGVMAHGTAQKVASVRLP